MAAADVLSESADDMFIRGKLGLPFDPDRAGTGAVREYSFAMFILRQRLLDIALWLVKGGIPAETTLQRSQFPDTQGIVSIIN